MSVFKMVYEKRLQLLGMGKKCLDIEFIQDMHTKKFNKNILKL
jgi:hypothetical protein